MLSKTEIEQYMISKNFTLFRNTGNGVKYWFGNGILTQIADNDIPCDDEKSIDIYIRRRCFDSRHPKLVNCNTCSQRILCETENGHKAGVKV